MIAVMISSLLLAAAPLPAQVAPLPNDFLAFANQVLANVDRGNAGLVWDRGSPLMKSTLARDRFVAEAEHDRSQHGAVTTRQWTRIERTLVTVSSKPLIERPAVIVTFTSKGGRGPVFNESVEFILDRTDSWRTLSYHG